MQDLWLFSVVAFVACLTPGPAVLYNVSRGLNNGPGVLTASPLGITIGVGLMSAISATGLGALIASSPAVYNALQMLSVLMLIWFGWQSWRSGSLDLKTAAGAVAKTRQSWREIFTGAVLLQAVNPTVIVFLLSLMPQFIQPEHDYVTRVTVLSVIFTAACFAAHMIYSTVAVFFSSRLAGSAFSLWLNRISAVLFWFLAVSMIRSLIG